MEAPESLSGLEVEIHFLELMANGFYEDLGIEKVDFGDFEVGAFDFDTQQIEYEPYSYVKTSKTTALITLGVAGSETEEIELTFIEPEFAEGTWVEIDKGEIFAGTLTFRILRDNNDPDPSDPNGGGDYPETPGVIREAMVKTEVASLLKTGEIQLFGSVLSDGGGEISEFGFVLSPRLNDPYDA